MDTDLDFGGWVQTHNDLISKYGNTFKSDDGRSYSGEIRYHKGIEKFDWLVQSGTYDGQRGRFDAYIAAGDASSLAEAQQLIVGLIEKLQAPEAHLPSM